VQEFIRAEEELYPGVVDIQNKWIAEVDNTRGLSTRRTPKGLPAGVGYITSITGKRYVFYEEDAPNYVKRQTGRSTSFKPTKIKNYPVNN
jgi:hypothetical protein